jgi:hypothetical protein
MRHCLQRTALGSSRRRFRPVEDIGESLYAQFPTPRCCVDVIETVRAGDCTESLDKAMNRTCEREPALPLKYRGPDETSRLVHHSQEGEGASTLDCPAYLRDLNFAQRAAVEYGVSDGAASHISGPLLIIAGAGTGKTNTLAHRVAHLIMAGTLPERILLLTFTRRAASEMTEGGSAHPDCSAGDIKAEASRAGWRIRLVGHLPRNWQPLITRTRQQPRTRFLVHGSRSFRFGRPPQLRSQRSGLGGITSSITRSRGREAGSSSRREASRSNPRGRMAVAAARVEPAAAFAVAPREAGFRAAP